MTLLICDKLTANKDLILFMTVHESLVLKSRTRGVHGTLHGGSNTDRGPPLTHHGLRVTEVCGGVSVGMVVIVVLEGR